MGASIAAQRYNTPDVSRFLGRPLRSTGFAIVLVAVVAAAGIGLVAADWPSPGLNGSDLTRSDAPDSVKPAGSTQNPDITTNTTTTISTQAPFSAASKELIAEISQQAFIDATLAVSEAFFGVIRGEQPNLNILQQAGGDVSAVESTSADTPANVAADIAVDAPGGITTNVAADPYGDIAADNAAISEGARSIAGAVGQLSLLVRFPNRLDFKITDAWERQHEWLLTTALAQAEVCLPDSTDFGCDDLVAQLTPSFEPPAGGEYERVAQERTTGTSVPASMYLTAAFELALWRPVEMHPAAADIYRQVAASTRLQTDGVGDTDSAGGTNSGCDISALWIAAAVESQMPLVGVINFGEIYLTGQLADNAHKSRTYDIPSLARFVVRKGCGAAATLKLVTDTPFWHRFDTSNLSERISLAINPTLARWRTYDAELIGSFRSCDIVERIFPRSETVFVNGFQVHPCLSETLTALFASARTDGIYLNGGGWRSTQQQVTLRISNCALPPRHADNYRIELSLAPSSICNPETAPPGRSRHEAGLALDFVCGDSDQALGYDRCYRWLVRNAHLFGLYNLLSERWHWSIDGR